MTVSQKKIEGIIEISEPNDYNHLGILIGEKSREKIIAVSTSAVFNETSLVSKFWGMDCNSIDNGFQGHLYTHPNDTLVVYVPKYDENIPNKVMVTLKCNYEIWKSLTGIKLLSGSGRIILTSNASIPKITRLPKNIAWYAGNILQAAADEYLNSNKAFLAFVLNNHLINLLGEKTRLKKQADAITLLMDKNKALELLLENEIECPKTYFINNKEDCDLLKNSLLLEKLYVFKPSGGAAGIGVFSNDRKGADKGLIMNHINQLKLSGQLPQRFQIQEFIPGISLGATTSINRDGTFIIHEIHQQIINETERYIGGRWTAKLQSGQMDFIRNVCKKIAAIKKPRIWGNICMDFIDGKIIEINPRLTASAPIAHILRQQVKLRKHLGTDFTINQIDLNTNLKIDYGAICNGKLTELIKLFWKETGIIILPQGLSPCGNSRFMFINDDNICSVQQKFIENIAEI